MDKANCKLLVYRQDKRPSRLRSYKIFIDDEEVGLIQNGEEKIIYLSPGIHTIWAKIDWLKSNKKVFEINYMEPVKIEIGIQKPRFKEYAYYGLYGIFMVLGAILLFLQNLIIIAALLMGLGGFFLSKAICRPYIYD